MLDIQDGQCGTCAHFGGDNSGSQVLVQVRISHKAEPDMVETCGHPENAPRDLKVSAVSTCAGFTPAKVA